MNPRTSEIPLQRVAGCMWPSGGSAVAAGDTTTCLHCGGMWDTGDAPYPPPCVSNFRAQAANARGHRLQPAAGKPGVLVCAACVQEERVERGWVQWMGVCWPQYLCAGAALVAGVLIAALVLWVLP